MATALDSGWSGLYGVPTFDALYKAMKYENDVNAHRYRVLGNIMETFSSAFQNISSGAQGVSRNVTDAWRSEAGRAVGARISNDFEQAANAAVQLKNSNLQDQLWELAAAIEDGFTNLHDYIHSIGILPWAQPSIWMRLSGWTDHDFVRAADQILAPVYKAFNQVGVSTLLLKQIEWHGEGGRP